MEADLSNKNYIRQVIKEVRQAKALMGSFTKKGHYFVNGEKFAFPLTPKNTHYALKDVKKNLKKVS